MPSPYPGIYRAKALRLDGSNLAALIPQIFGEETVTITAFVGSPPAVSEMGWVAFHGGLPSNPVWLGTGIGGGTGTVGGITQTQADLRYLMLAGGTLTGDLVLPATAPATDNHATTKGYVDTQVGTRLTQAAADTRYVNVAGDTMTGPLVLPGLPTLDLQAATKSYVDTNIAAGAVPATRSVLTTPPLTGGGDLTTNRTLAVSTATDLAVGVVELATVAEVITGTDNVRAVTPLGAAQKVPLFRTINTTAPLTGGGDLTSNRVLDISIFTTTVKGAVPAPATLTGRFLKDDGTWAIPSGTGLTQAAADPLYINVTGDTMTGPLALAADPTLPLQAATKQYVDTQRDTRLTQALADGLYVNTLGDTMTGLLTLSADPSLALHAATKQYVDTQRDTRQPLDTDLTTIAGLTATTGNLIQSVGSAWASQTPAQVKTTLVLVKGDVGLGNVDNTSDVNKPVSTAQAAADALRLLKAGDTMTAGDLTLFRDPTAAMHAASKQYVDTHLTQAEADPLYINVLGDTMTGQLTMSHDIVQIGAGRKITARVLRTVNGGASGAPAEAISFGYNGVEQYPFTIFTEHHSTQNSGNKLHFRLWKVTDPIAGPSTNNVMTLGGDLITAYFPLALPADPTAALHAATKQYVDTHLTQTEADALYVNVDGDTMGGPLTLNAGTSVLGGAVAFGTRSGAHILLSSTDHVIGVQGPSGGGQDTVYMRSPNAFYWYRGGAHDPVRGLAGGGLALLAMSDVLFTYKGSKIWTAADNGHTIDSTGINADRLDSKHAIEFANREEMEALLGDLLYAGLYDAASYVPAPPATADATKPHPTWSGGPNVYRHGMYWVCSSSGQLDFIDADLSGRYDAPITFDIDTTQLTSNVATLTVVLPAGATSHGGEVGGFIFVSGESAAFNGRYPLTAVTATTLTYALVNPYANQAVTPGIGTVKLVYDEQIPVNNGDWIVAIDSAFNPAVPGHDEGSDLSLSAMTFQYIPFSTETYVKNQILMHVAAEDPHAQYLRPEEADVAYAPKDHSHPGEIRQHIIEHMDISDWPVTAWMWEAGTVTLTVPPRSGIDHNIQPLGSFNLFNVHPDFNNKKWPVLDVELDVDEAGAGQVRFTYVPTPSEPPSYVPGTLVSISPPGQIHHDPHAQYLETEEADLLYAPFDHNHDLKYEPIGAVEYHECKTDPHPQYLTETDGEALFLNETEANLLYSFKDHTHPEILEVHATDGAVSADIWVGDVEPTVFMGLAVGDIWIETPAIDVQVPSVHQLTVTNGAVGTSVVVGWQPWDSSELVDAISLERSTDGTTWPPAGVLTNDEILTSYTDSGAAIVPNTTYYYRILAHNSAGNGLYSPTVSIVTKPAAPPSVNATSSAYNQASCTWTAPVGGTYTYDVYLNNVLKVSNTSGPLSYTALGVTENTTYTFAVRAKSALSGLYSATVSDAITTVNAVPLAPTSLADSAPTSSSLTLAWTASASADRKDYQVYRGTTNPPTTYVATTAATSYKFTGLSSSTLYYLSVRTRDTHDAVSALAPAVSGSTAAPPDTTPPTAPTIQSFQPQTTYGNMVLNATLGAGTAEYRIDSSTNNSTWTIELNWTARGPGAIPARSIGTYDDGTTVYCRIYARDAAGNTTYANAASYTLIVSPTYITATATNHYRANGTWNAMGTSRPVQGYYSNDDYNATGCWFYGTKPNTTLYYGNRRTITSGNIWLKRMDGGDGVDRDITIRVHTDTSQPAGAPGWQGQRLISTPIFRGMVRASGSPCLPVGRTCSSPARRTRASPSSSPPPTTRPTT